MKKIKKNIKLLGAMALLIITCTFVLELPFYVTMLIMILVLPIIFFSSTIAIYGNLLYVKGNNESSRKVLKKAIDLKTKSPAAHLNYAVLLMHNDAKQAGAALNYLKRAEALNTQAMLGKNISLAMGSCYWLLGEVDKSIEVLEGMRKRYDYVNDRVLATLGYMYFLKEDYDMAIEISQEAIEDNPESAAAWDNIGQVYLKKNDIEKAKESFEKAIGYKADMPDSLYYMGIIAEMGDNKALAKEYFEQAARCNISGLSTITREMLEEKLITTEK